MAKLPAVSLPYSKIKLEIAKLLELKNFVGEVSFKGKKNKRNIEIVLFYDAAGRAKISEIKQISKPSRRVYSGWRELKPAKSGFGFYILSTPSGIIDNQKARQIKAGGEILGIIW